VPVFEITGKEDGAGSVPAHANLESKFVGPESLDQVTVTILDDVGRYHWAHGLPEGLMQEQADVFVGPLGVRRCRARPD
jgi:hypothetical protein